MKTLLISGSPTKDGSTEILLDAVAGGIKDTLNEKFSPEEANESVFDIVRLNELNFIPCQSCGESPEPKFCFFDDDLSDVYIKLVECDIVVMGTPIFFDSVSGQTKMFIDRCSCFRPPDFDGTTTHMFKKLGLRRRAGGAVLVAGERGRFDLAQSVLKGFFKWTEIDTHGFVLYESPDFRASGLAKENQTALKEARALGKTLVDRALSKEA